MIELIKKLFKFADKKIDLKKFTKFGITGIVNTGVDWLVFTVLCGIFAVDPKISQITAQFIAIINSYIINKNWTFRNSKNSRNSRNSKKYRISEIIKFLIVQGTSLLIGYTGMFILHDNLGVNEYLSKIIISCATVIINYFGNKLFVFT